MSGVIFTRNEGGMKGSSGTVVEILWDHELKNYKCVCHNDSSLVVTFKRPRVSDRFGTLNITFGNFLTAHK